jgi:hypothetical protein
VSVRFLPTTPELTIADAVAMTDEDLLVIRRDIETQLTTIKTEMTRRKASNNFSDQESRWMAAARRVERIHGLNIQTICREQAARHRRGAAERAGATTDVDHERVRARERRRHLKGLLGTEGAAIARAQAFITIAKERMPEDQFNTWLEEANAACLEAASSVDQGLGVANGTDDGID